jgi:hypothetical protein
VLTIGGSVFPVDKLQILMPWLCLAGGFVLIGGAVFISAVRKRSSRRNLN